MDLPSEIVRLMQLCGYTAMTTQSISLLSAYDQTALLRHAQYCVRSMRQGELLNIFAFYNIDYPALIQLHLRPEAVLAIQGSQIVLSFPGLKHYELNHIKDVWEAVQRDVRAMLYALSYNHYNDNDNESAPQPHSQSDSVCFTSESESETENEFEPKSETESEPESQPESQQHESETENNTQPTTQHMIPFLNDTWTLPMDYERL